NQLIEVRNLAIIGKRPENTFRFRVVEYRPEWLALCLSCSLLFKALAAAAFWKCASCYDAAPPSRLHSVSYPQALACVIGGAEVLTTVDHNRAVRSQFPREQLRHEIRVEQQVALRQHTVCDQRRGASRGDHSNLSVLLVNPS